MLQEVLFLASVGHQCYILPCQFRWLILAYSCLCLLWKQEVAPSVTDSAAGTTHCYPSSDWISCVPDFFKMTHSLVQRSLGQWLFLHSVVRGELYHRRWKIPKLLVSVSYADAKSLQLCPTVCDSINSNPPGYPVPGVLQARTLEWIDISFSNAWKWKVKVKSLSHVQLLATPWTVAYQAPLSMRFSRQEYWSGFPLLHMLSPKIMTKPHIISLSHWPYVKT